MWWAELLVFVAVSVAAFMGAVFLLPDGPVNLGPGPSIALLALSMGIGVYASGRFRAWGLRRLR
jgi:hypothetical protein